MSRSIDISPEHHKLVIDILGKYIPDREVVVFGSRVKGTTKKSSDLDLCVMGKDRLSALTLSNLIEAFDEAPLPFKVDIVEWPALQKFFQDIIASDNIKIGA